MIEMGARITRDLAGPWTGPTGRRSRNSWSISLSEGRDRTLEWGKRIEQYFDLSLSSELWFLVAVVDRTGFHGFQLSASELAAKKR